MSRLILIFNFFSTFAVFSQITDNFDDGNFNSTPEWIGSTANFTINSSNQLQTLPSSVSSTSYLSTFHGLTSLENMEWKCWIKMGFSPSTSNYSKVYLTSTSSDLSSNPDGYYLKFGESGTSDKIRLYRQENGISTEICSGASAQIATSFSLSVKVTRDKDGNWKLFVDAQGGEEFSTFALGTDTTEIVGTAMGVFCKYTKSNSTKFYFDNFYIGNQLVDLLPPILISATPISERQIDVLFDQIVEKNSAETTSNFSLLPTISISSAKVDSSNASLIHLELNSSLKNGQKYELSTKNIADNMNNNSGNQSVVFEWRMAEFPEVGDVIITEIMADPTPIVGLPEVEYVEIFNKSSKYFDVEDWKLGDASGFGTIAQKWLLPGEYLILYPSTFSGELAAGVRVSSFPSLNNSGDQLILQSNEGKIIDHLSYTDEWYKNETKKEGGYSLERINPYAICSKSTNWRASDASTGGTPALLNSVNDTTSDVSKPFIIEISIKNSNQIDLYFNEEMDATSLANSSFSITPHLDFQSRTIDSILPKTMEISFSDSIQVGQDYTIVLNSIADCSQNTTSSSGTFVRASTPQKGDLIINEILYNPITGGSDFVELKNNSSGLINLNNCYLANYEKGEIANKKQIEWSGNLKSGEYVIITPDSTFQKTHYPFNGGRFIQQEIPAFLNDSSTVYLLHNEEVIDKVSYQDKWQFALIDDPKGKSLERIDPAGNSNEATNWHTAGESVGFATPGLANSQQLSSLTTGNFEYTSKTISPDNDGFEDVLMIHYNLKYTNLVGTFTIFDAEGRIVRTVMNNQLLGTEGSFSWDGISDNQIKATIGTYIGVFEAFDNTNGSVFTKTKAFVVAGKL